MRTIVLVSSGQPSLNPRLVKEADILISAGYEVFVIYQYWNDWGTTADEKLLKSKQWRAHRAGGAPTSQKATYLLNRIIQKVALKCCKLGLFAFAEFALARSYYFLIREAKKIKADLYIAHNLGALPVAVRAAKLNHAKVGFDAEDFHRYETSDSDANFDVRLKKYIENKYFKHLDYLTAASPLIGAHYNQLFPDLEPTVILNAFSRSFNPEPATVENAPIKLFWFSQTIGTNRGIQDIIKALSLIDFKQYELHLLGALPKSVKQQFDTLIDSLFRETLPTIIFHDCIPEEQLLREVSNYDLGFAIEPGFSLNNKIALSNKIFSYINGGIAIIYSNTPGQKEFYEKFPASGSIYDPGDFKKLAELLKYYHNHKDVLLKQKLHNYKLGQHKLNWEVEGDKFLTVISSQFLQI